MSLISPYSINDNQITRGEGEYDRVFYGPATGAYDDY